MSRLIVLPDLAGRHFPDPDCFTVEEYHRLSPPEPAPLRPRPPAVVLTCPHCGGVFTPHPLATKARFCRSICRRRFHARLSVARKKALAS